MDFIKAVRMTPGPVCSICMDGQIYGDNISVVSPPIEARHGSIFIIFEIYSRSYRAKKECEHFSSPEKKEHLAEREDAQISAPARAP